MNPVRLPLTLVWIRFRTPLYFTSPAFLAVAILSGCGVAPADKSPTASVAENGTLPSETAGSVKVVEQPTATSADAEVTSFPAEVSEEPTTPDDATATSNSDSAKPDLKLTELTLTDQQRQRWPVAKFESLKLLAYRERLSDLKLAICSGPLPTGEGYLTGGKSVCLWNTMSSEPTWSIPVPGDSGTTGDPVLATTIDCSADGKLFAYGDTQGFVRVCQLMDGTVVSEQKLHPGKVFSVGFSSDSSRLASTSSDSKVAISSVEDLAQTKTLTLDCSGIQKIGFLGTDSIVAVGETAGVYGATDGKLLLELPTPRYAFGITADAMSYLLTTGKQIVRLSPSNDIETVLEGTFDTSEMVAVSADRKRIATTGASAIRIWDADSKRCVQWIDVAGDTLVGLHWSQLETLVSIHATGPTRIWGTEQVANAQGLQAVHASGNSSSEANVKPMAKVASAVEWLEAIDLRVFPIPSPATTEALDKTNLSYEVSLSPEDAKLYTRYQLGEQQWVEQVPSNNPHALVFLKGNFVLTCTFYEAQAGKTNVGMTLSGFDLQTLPRFSGKPTTEVYADRNTVIVQTEADISSIEVELLGKFRDFGCVPFVRLNSSRSTLVDERRLTFLLGPVEITCTIQPAPSAPQSYTVSLTSAPALNAPPIPPRVDYVEYSDAPTPTMVYTTVSDVAELVTFYDEAMASGDWVSLASHRQIDEKQGWLSYLRDGRDLMVRLNKAENGIVVVTIGEVAVNGSYTLSLFSKTSASSDAKDIQQIADKLEAAEFPMPMTVINPRLDRVAEILEFEVPGVAVSRIAEGLTGQLSKLGWVAETGGIRGEDYTNIVFAKGKLSIELRATDRNGTVNVNIQGDGLAWTKELPGATRSLPYEQWLMDHRKPLNLKELNAFTKGLE